MERMRAVGISNGKGPAGALFIDQNVQIPKVQDGEVLVKIKAFGLNKMDVIQREGNYPVPTQAPKTLGVEFSGIVQELSPGVEGFGRGDEVFGLGYGGAYAEYIAVSAKTCIHKPAELTFEEAAGISEVWFTAIQALITVGGFKPGQSVMVHAAASGVGIAIIQLIRHISPQSIIFATASSTTKLDFCTKTLGATHGINYRDTDFSKEVLSLTQGEGVELIIDFPGQSHFQKNINCAAIDGKIVLLGLLSGNIVKELDISPILSKRLRIEGSTLRSRSPEYQGMLRDKLVGMALEAIKRRELRVFVEKVLSWKDIIDAHKLMETSETKGKIICIVD